MHVCFIPGVTNPVDNLQKESVSFEHINFNLAKVIK